VVASGRLIRARVGQNGGENDGTKLKKTEGLTSFLAGRADNAERSHRENS